MKRACFVSLLLCLTTSLLSQSNPVSLIDQTARVASPISTSQPDPQAQARILDGFGKLPLSFEANQGQSDPQVKFLSRGTGYSLFLTSNEAVLTFQPSIPSPARSGQAKEGHQPPVSHQPSAGAVLRMKLLNTNPKAEVSGQDELPGKSNYFIGNHPKQWHTNVRQFAKVRYANVYPGVDLVYYGHQRELEYDFVLQPGANPAAIRLGIAGAKRLRLEHGDLVLTSAGGDVHLRSPHIYQEANGDRHEVRGRYVIKSKNEVGFEVAAYDRRQALVIDPVLAYSTYLGGSGGDYGNGIAVDLVGNAYVTGYTASGDFPVIDAIQPTQHALYGCCNAFVTKINADGTALIYSTYLGGSYSDGGNSIAVDTAGNAYLTGNASSTDFPTVNAIQPLYGGGGDAFVTKVNASGSALVYSTYLGGSAEDYGFAIAVDSASNAYVTGETYSSDFPTVNAIQPTLHFNAVNAFVTKINAAGSAFVYSTYLGGRGRDLGTGIAVDAAGEAYVTGAASSPDFPTVNAVQPTNHGSLDAFVTKLNTAGSAYVYSTYLGGSGGDGGHGIAVDTAGNAYVTGNTDSNDFPTTADAFQKVCGGSVCSYPTGGDAFVTKINAAGSAFVYSTYLGGSGDDEGDGVAVDAGGNAYVAGSTASTDFPVLNAIQPKKHGGYDAFVTEINAGGTAPVYSTYLGGGSDDLFNQSVRVDAQGSLYTTGGTHSKNFPVTPLAFQQSLKGTDENAFVFKIAAQTFVGLSQLPPFPTQLLGTTSAAKKATLTNRGASILTIKKIYIGGVDPGDFAETNACGSTLAPNATCTIDVTFTPSAKNLRKAGLGVSSLDPASPNAIALSGSGTVVSLSKKNLSFGEQPVGATSPPETVTLTNMGNAQLNFTAISITGTNAGDFAETNNCGSGIAAGANCTISVTFTPTAIGKRTAAVTIKDDGGGSPQTLYLNTTELYSSHTSLTASPNPSLYGQPVTLTATVTSAGPAPTGTVTFRMGTFVMGSPTLNSSGVATFTTAKIPARVFRLTSTYNGDASNGKSVSAIWQTVNQISISMALTSTPNPSALGTSVKFTATLTSNGLLPSGQPVTFSCNGATLGTANVNSKGVATFYTKTLPHGSNPVTATYAGTMNYSPASATVTQVVN